MKKFFILFFLIIPDLSFSNDTYLEKKEVQDFIIYMKEKHDYNQVELEKLFSEITPNKKIKKYCKK